MNLQALKKAFAPVHRRLRMFAGRGTVRMSDDSGGMQLLQIEMLKDERIPGVKRAQNFGFTSRPRRGATCVVLCMAGSRSYPIVISVEDREARYRDLEEGESCHQNAFGDYILIDKDGNITVKASTKVTVDAPEAEFTGNVTINGNLTVLGSATVQQDLVVDGDGSFGGTGFFTGDLSSASDIFDTLRSLQEMVDIYNGHHHGGSPLPDALMS